MLSLRFPCEPRIPAIHIQVQRMWMKPFSTLQNNSFCRWMQSTDYINSMRIEVLHSPSLAKSPELQYLQFKQLCVGVVCYTAIAYWNRIWYLESGCCCNKILCNVAMILDWVVDKLKKAQADWWWRLEGQGRNQYWSVDKNHPCNVVGWQKVWQKHCHLGKMENIKCA